MRIKKHKNGPPMSSPLLPSPSLPLLSCPPFFSPYPILLSFTNHIYHHFIYHNYFYFYFYFGLLFSPSFTEFFDALPSSIVRTRDAKFNEQKVSSTLYRLGLTQTIIRVFESWDRLSCSKYVSVELRNGTCDWWIKWSWIKLSYVCINDWEQIVKERINKWFEYVSR